MKTKNFINLAVICAMLMFTSGCLTTRTGEPLTPEQIARLIRTTSNTGTFITLKEVYDDEVERLKVARRLANTMEQALKVVEEGQKELTYAIVDVLLNRLQSEYGAIVATALSVFAVYFEAPSADDVLTPEYVLYLKSLLGGIYDGANIFLINVSDTEAR